MDIGVYYEGNCDSLGRFSEIQHNVYGLEELLAGQGHLKD